MRLLTILMVLLVQADTQRSTELENKLGFFIGQWELTTRDVTRERSFQQGRAASHAHYILGGRAIADDFYQLSAEGDTLFAGTSIRSYNEQTRKFQVTWVMPGNLGITDLEAVWEDGEFKGEGKGYDGMGEFVERFSYYDISRNEYKFNLDRSYDGGTTWIKEFSQFTARRIR